MPITQVTTDFTGEVNVVPKLVRVNCNDDLATVMGAGYLNGRNIHPTDFICVNYSGGQNTFRPVFEDGIITLELQNTGIIVDTPTVAGNFPKFVDTDGNQQDSGIAITELQLSANIKGNIASYAGGSATFSIATTGMTSSSPVNVTFKTQANAASILTAAGGTNVINIVATADPGASTLNWHGLVSPQT